MVEVKMDTTSFDTNVKAMLGRAMNATYAFNLIAAQMEATTIRRFKTTTSPDGARWKPLADSTVARRRKGSSVPLSDTGTLKNSIAGSGKAGSKQATVSTNIQYAAIHNYGGKAGRGRKVNIPQRQFMGIAAGEVKRYNAILNRYIVEGS